MKAVEVEKTVCGEVLEIIKNEEMGGYSVKIRDQGVVEWRYCENAACVAHLGLIMGSYAVVSAA